MQTEMFTRRRVDPSIPTIRGIERQLQLGHTISKKEDRVSFPFAFASPLFPSFNLIGAK